MSFATRLRHRFETPSLPINAVRRIYERPRCVFDGNRRAPVQLTFQGINITADQQNQRNRQSQSTPGTTALDKFAKNPRRERDDHKKNAEPQDAFAIITGGKIEQPHGSRQHWKAHHNFEFLHPRARLW